MLDKTAGAHRHISMIDHASGGHKEVPLQMDKKVREKGWTSPDSWIPPKQKEFSSIEESFFHIKSFISSLFTLMGIPNLVEPSSSTDICGKYIVSVTNDLVFLLPLSYDGPQKG
ncbi:hypothetical protein ACLOJK_023954, partial [Asimina triloba]